METPSEQWPSAVAQMWLGLIKREDIGVILWVTDKYNGVKTIEPFLKDVESIWGEKIKITKLEPCMAEDRQMMMKVGHTWVSINCILHAFHSHDFVFADENGEGLLKVVVLSKMCTHSCGDHSKMLERVCGGLNASGFRITAVEQWCRDAVERELKQCGLLK